MVGRAPLLAGIVLGGFLLPNLAGLFLWQHRDRVSPYVALQGVTGLIGVCGVGVLVAIQRAGQFPAFEPRLSASVASYGFLTMVLGLMGWFWVLERTAIRKRSGQC
jgi:hypothetical protein